MFHYNSREKVIYMCLTEADYRIALAKKFLLDIEEKFTNIYGKNRI